MIKRLSLLNGLAILAVVCNHSTQLGYIAMFQWTNRYRPVSVPNYDQMGSLTFYALTVIEKLAVFSVPAFLFFSGFFVAFAARGNKSTLNWRMVRVRVVNLAIPYLIWSIVIFVTDAAQGSVVSPIRYVYRLLYGGAIPHYFFVPLLVQLYLLSPFLVNLAKERGRLLLLGSAAIQVGVVSFYYLNYLFPTVVPLQLVVGVMKYWSWFPMWIFFFSFGVWSGFNVERLRDWITCYKWQLLATTVVSGALAVVEADYFFQNTGLSIRDMALTYPSMVYAVSFILTFLAFEEVKIPFSKFFAQLSSRTYGIYLVHTKVLGYVALFIFNVLPSLLAHEIVLQPILITFGVAVPFLFMTAVARTPARKFYRFLFG